MKAIIVDDEYYAIQGLKMELEDIGGIEIAGMYDDGLRMLEEISEIRPDLLFLDIEMPQVNGFEVLERLADTGCIPDIVFVTAYNHYAVKAFEVNAIDYIVKPVTKSRLLKTLERIRPAAAPEKNTTLQINCFRHFSILMNGREVNSGWRTRKAEELIAFLISEKGGFVSKDKIAEALWPEQDHENALSNLYMAYYHIKKQESRTGIRIPVESERGKMRINTELLACDILEFDKLIHAGNRKDANEKAVCLEKAAELYRGMPFEDTDYAWVQMIQGFYEYRYMELLEHLIDYYRKKADEQKAAYYERKLGSICEKS